MLIRLIENTPYRYDPVYRFYGWEHADEIRPLSACPFASIGEFYLALLRAWSIETCSARFRPLWSAENPSAGQCSITAVIVRELFGGEIFGLPLEGGGMHSFNKIGGVIVDLACEQFGKDALPDFAGAVPIDPEELLRGGDKAERCALLRQRLGLA